MSASPKTVLRALIILLIFFGIAGYAYTKSADLLSGPQIAVATPANGSTSDQERIIIRGTAQNISFLYLNDRQIYTDTDGTFREQLLLYPGYNIITIMARDRFERTTTKRIEVVYNPPPDEDILSMIDPATPSTNH